LNGSNYFALCENQLPNLKILQKFNSFNQQASLTYPSMKIVG